jgi:hypothetical protein
MKAQPRLSLGNSPIRTSPEGATRYGENLLRPLNRLACTFLAPSAEGATGLSPGSQPGNRLIETGRPEASGRGAGADISWGLKLERSHERQQSQATRSFWIASATGRS